MQKEIQVCVHTLKVGGSFSSFFSLSLRRSNRARPFSLCTNNPTSKMDLASQIWGRTSQALTPGPFEPWEAQSHCLVENVSTTISASVLNFPLVIFRPLVKAVSRGNTP